MKLSKSLNSNISTSVDISDLDRGIYLVFANDLYHGWSVYNFGILINYSSSRRQYIELSSSGLTLTVSGDTLVTTTSGRYIWGAKFFYLGYY